MPKRKEKSCFRCKGKHMLVGLDMGINGRIHLCLICWKGIAYGLREDLNNYELDPHKFFESTGHQKVIDKIFSNDDFRNKYLKKQESK